MRLFAAILAAAICAAAVPAGAQNAETRDEMHGAAFVMPVQCVDTTFVKVTDRFGGPIHGTGAGPNGMDVVFANKISLVAYSVSAVVVRERPGDRVQLCYLGHVEGTQACNPKTDDRGRLYRVYDYRLHMAWSATNSEHACGGA
ncbi:MAG TPA: hypothetical protein VII82_04675 [Polyangiaceae bacterium]|jgi:hypothetical protein